MIAPTLGPAMPGEEKQQCYKHKEGCQNYQQRSRRIWHETGRGFSSSN